MDCPVALSRFLPPLTGSVSVRGSTIEHEVVWLHPDESQFSVDCSSGVVRYQYVSSASTVARCLDLDPTRLPDLALVLGSNASSQSILFGDYCDLVAERAELYALYKRRMAKPDARACDNFPLCERLDCIYKHKVGSALFLPPCAQSEFPLTR